PCSVFTTLPSNSLSLTPKFCLQVFQKTPTPPNALQNKSEAGERSRTEVCMITSLLRYVCRVSHSSVSSPGHGGCKLCPQSWQLFGDQCYQVSKSTGNWTEGKKDCDSRGSHLAVFRNTTDMVRLNHHQKGFGGPFPPLLIVWIGLKVSNNTWKWVDNSSFDATTFDFLGSAENGCATLKDKNDCFPGEPVPACNHP
uniref:C-type lectin domain-containing protein n=1 Tax=Anas platyrhynchos platyrhynchos TaxID=8840 RepID=A0A493U495_ANAPP